LDDFDLEDCAQFDSADSNEGDFGGVPVISPFLTPSGNPSVLSVGRVRSIPE